LVIGVPRVSDWCKGPKDGSCIRSAGMLSQKLDAMLKDAKIDGINVKFRK
jgi:hypothetical protein